MDLDQFAALRTPEGSAVLAAATEVAGGDPLVAAASLRSRGVPAGLAAAALTQAELRRRAVGKFGPEAAGMFLTRPGLEQATRRVVADRRAARLAAAGVHTLADLGCGLGADALAAARAGIRVYGVEADPVTAALAAANAEAAGLAAMFTVECGDATAFDVTRVDAVFCDPARRRAGTGRRIFDPDAYSPPWDFVTGLAGRVPHTVVKVAPGLDHARIPAGTEAEWVSVDGDLVEAALWGGPLAGVPRRATVLRPTGGHQVTGAGDTEAAVGPVRRYLYDPDPAVVRAHLVAELAGTLDATLADPSIAYLYADAPRPTPFGRCLEIVDVLPFSLKRLRALLRERRVGRVEILKRGSALVPEQLRRDLRLAGGNPASLVLTRVAGAPTVLVGRPVADAGADAGADADAGAPG
ncbi:methyltransferase domain-containing protein [Micromonospora rifamycinica]|uniref:THUMP-like domain-containing protein n=1 Tax=Micromonospora rifamycinica TaxID=291594 RepID=UPI0033FF8CD2